MVTKSKLHLIPLAILFGLGIVFCGSGCSTLQIGNYGQTVPADTGTTNSAETYEVRMQGKFHKGVGYRGVIDGPITVQTALERSGAIEKFRAMDITVMRVVKESGKPLKLPVVYSGSKKTVRPEQDYALHPNDIIMVNAQTKNPLDKFVSSITPN